MDYIILKDVTGSRAFFFFLIPDFLFSFILYFFYELYEQNYYFSKEQLSFSFYPRVYPTTVTLVLFWKYALGRH